MYQIASVNCNNAYVRASEWKMETF